VLCVEAAFHFDTRERFLREALRVLRPGGWLALSDLLMTRGTPLVPAANHLRSLEEYAALLRRCGFVDVRVQDATRETWQSFRRRFTDFVLARASRFGSAHGVRDLLAANLACAFAIRAGLLAVARRP
jgi:SAM-dependent methyltransferase